MNSYDELRRQFSVGWQTWDNASIFSYLHMPEKLGFRLGLRDYEKSAWNFTALVGGAPEHGTVIPCAHTYDNGYTAARWTWNSNELLVETGLDGEDLVILVTPLAQPKKASTLCVEAQHRWNADGWCRRSGGTLQLCTDDTVQTVHVTGTDTGEVFVPCTGPYLCAALDGPVGISTGRARSAEEIRTVLAAQKLRWQQSKERYGVHAEAYNAMQTCLAWDTVYNPETGAPCTPVSRVWNNIWGGYVLFCWDTYFGALMEAPDNPALACCNAIAITHALTENGFVPNYVTQHGIKSFDRSQPPVGSMCCLEIWRSCGWDWFLAEVFDDLLAWNRWYFRCRRGKNGLLAWGSDLYEGTTGHVLETKGVHDRQGAAYESGLDNSPMFDDIPFDSGRNILLLEDVGLTGMYIRDCRSLAEIAQILGRTAEADELLQRCEETELALEQLWDDTTGMYLCRREDTGEFQHRLSPFHFHALFSRRAGVEHAERMIREHFYNPDEFWGEYILPSIARNDPAYPEQDYWRGRIWGPMNYLVYMALREYAPHSELVAQAVRDLAERSERLLLKEWLEKGHVHENYNSDTGEGCDVYYSDRYYHWGALLSFIALHHDGIF